MPVQVEEMSSEVSLVVGDLPLTEAQVEKLVKLVLKRLQERERAQSQQREATSVRRSASPPSALDR